MKLLTDDMCCFWQVPVGDTVGCGDSFAAAIVMGYIRGYDVPATMALANAVGAATAMGTGAGTNVASAQNVLKLLTDATTDSVMFSSDVGKGQNGSGMQSDPVQGNAAALQILQESLMDSSNGSAAAA